MSGSLADLSIRVRNSLIPKSYGEDIACNLGYILEKLRAAGNTLSNKSPMIRLDEKSTISSWNAKSLMKPNTCLHHLFEEVAQAVPNDTAIKAWDGSFTYKDLDLLSNGLASTLKSLGVGPGVFVPFAFEKSCWTTVAMLGILKAGAAFVPLDPEHPESRLRGILADVDAEILLTSSIYQIKFNHLVRELIIVSAGTVTPAECNQASSDHGSIARPSDPVFVLFTSGSTGRPKGIIHEHGGMSAHTLAYGRAAGYLGKRTLQFSAYTWDVAIIDTFTTIAFKGCLCVPSDEDRMFNTARTMEDMQVDIAMLTPSFAALIDPSDVPTLKSLLLTGEALKKETVRRWASKVCLMQAYGPAEVGVCILTEITSQFQRAEKLGSPINSKSFLVDPDDHNRLVPIGSVGELLVTGPSLAREYLKNDEMTQSSFIQDPSWAVELDMKNRRLYKTGDLLRYNIQAWDGSLDFVGRKDHQIKRHGQRVDVGEIEFHIASIPDVVLAMVTCPKEGCFKGDLVAIVQAVTPGPASLTVPLKIIHSESLNLDTVLGCLADRVPRYMLPNGVLVISSFPLSTSMKLERRKVDSWLANMLTPPIRSEPTSKIPQSELLSPFELTANTISRKFADLLTGTDMDSYRRIHHHDLNLQKAGVNSIQLISLSHFIQQTFNTTIPMPLILSSKVTIRDLAIFIDGEQSQSSVLGIEETKIDILSEAKHMTESLTHEVSLMIQPEEYHIFITGATGFLGLEVLRQLLQLPYIRVTALVRAPNDSEALTRLISLAISAAWWRSFYASRLAAWAGDLALPSLGLTSSHLQNFHPATAITGRSIHAIIHLGAQVHYNLDFDTVSPVNTSSTRELLRLAALSKVRNHQTAPSISSKVLPHPDLPRSSRGICNFTYISGGLHPTSTPDIDAHLAARAAKAGGYEQSKLLSELIIKRCAEERLFEGLRMGVMKMGYIVGGGELHENGESRAIGEEENETTVCRAKPVQRDFLWRLVLANVEIGGWNGEEGDGWLYIESVESVAAAVVEETVGFDRRDETGNQRCRVSKILSGMTVRDFWACAAVEGGYKLVELPYQIWMQRIRSRVDILGERHALFPVMHLLKKGPWIIGVREEEGGGGAQKVDANHGGRFKGVCGEERETGEIEEGERARMRNIVAANVRTLVESGFLMGKEEQRKWLDEVL